MNQEQWQAIKSRNPQYDAQFFCGLIKSKTVCRVSCDYRAREIRNIAVFPTLREALDAGYRPCTHCRPDRPAWAGSRQELVRAAKEYMTQHSTEKFSLDALSGSLFINGSYLSRVFKADTGHTLLWYHHWVRCEKAKELLTRNELSIAAVGDQAGFVSSAHFSRIFKNMLGITPSEYRNAYFQALEEADK